MNPDPVRFEARRDCAGPSEGTAVDYIAGAGESSAEAVMQPALGSIQRDHGPVTAHVIAGAASRAAQAGGQQSVVYRVDGANSEPVGEITVVEVSPGRWQLEGYGSCAVTWAGDRQTPPLDVLGKRGGGQVTPLRAWSESPHGDRLTVHFIGAPKGANEPCGVDYAALSTETAGTITIAITSIARSVPTEEGAGCTAIGANRTEIADLGAPLGNREVVDAVTGRTIPST